MKRDKQVSHPNFDNLGSTQNRFDEFIKFINNNETDNLNIVLDNFDYYFQDPLNLTDQNYTAFFSSVMRLSNNPELFKKILRESSKILGMNHVNSNGLSLISVFFSRFKKSEESKIDLVKFLFDEFRLDFNKPDMTGLRPLSHSLLCEDYEVSSYLVRRGVEIRDLKYSYIVKKGEKTQISDVKFEDKIDLINNLVEVFKLNHESEDPAKHKKFFSFIGFLVSDIDINELVASNKLNIISFILRNKTLLDGDRSIILDQEVVILNSKIEFITQNYKKYEENRAAIEGVISKETKDRNDIEKKYEADCSIIQNLIDLTEEEAEKRMGVMYDDGSIDLGIEMQEKYEREEIASFFKKENYREELYLYAKELGKTENKTREIIDAKEEKEVKNILENFGTELKYLKFKENIIKTPIMNEALGYIEELLKFPTHLFHEASEHATFTNIESMRASRLNFIIECLYNNGNGVKDGIDFLEMLKRNKGLKTISFSLEAFNSLIDAAEEDTYSSSRYNNLYQKMVKNYNPNESLVYQRDEVKTELKNISSLSKTLSILVMVSKDMLIHNIQTQVTPPLTSVTATLSNALNPVSNMNELD